jgi:hypothetical protein
MTNQAAQTMPTYFKTADELVTFLDSLRDLDGEGGDGVLKWQPAQHAIAGIRAAALSQPAGVAEWPLSGKYGDVLRPFVVQMERELHANAGKGDRPGWLKMSPEVALLEIYYHLSKLQKAVKDDNGPGIQEYAADVANMSMMLLDICGGLALIEYAAPAASGGESPSGASVSERAREIVAFINGRCTNEEAGRKCLGFFVQHGDHLIRALSSPRQEGDSTAASTQGLREGIMAMSARFRADAAKLRESAARARKQESAGYHPAIDSHELQQSSQDADGYADELESLLTSPTTGADGGRE